MRRNITALLAAITLAGGGAYAARANVGASTSASRQIPTGESAAEGNGGLAPYAGGAGGMASPSDPGVQSGTQFYQSPGNTGAVLIGAHNAMNTPSGPTYSDGPLNRTAKANQKAGSALTCTGGK